MPQLMLGALDYWGSIFARPCLPSNAEDGGSFNALNKRCHSFHNLEYLSAFFRYNVLADLVHRTQRGGNHDGVAVVHLAVLPVGLLGFLVADGGSHRFSPVALWW